MAADTCLQIAVLSHLTELRDEAQNEKKYTARTTGIE